MPDVNTIVQLFTVHDPKTLLTVLASGTGVALTLQVIKHYGKLGEAKKTVVFLLTALSFLASLADSVLQFSGQNPKLIVGSHLGSIVAVAVIAHRFAISPAYYKLVGWLEAIASDKAAAAAYRSQQAVNIPITGQEFTIGL